MYLISTFFTNPFLVTQDFLLLGNSELASASVDSTNLSKTLAAFSFVHSGYIIGAKLSHSDTLTCFGTSSPGLLAYNMSNVSSGLVNKNLPFNDRLSVFIAVIISHR